VLAGSAAGIAGLAVFLVLHHLWIVPIWFVAPLGSVMAGVGGGAVGASYAALRSHLPPWPWSTVAVIAVVTAMLMPAVLVAQVRGPILTMDADGDATLLVPTSDAVVDVLVGLIGVSALAGAVLGALIGRSRRAAATTMLAGVALAIGPGHNVPLVGGTPAVAKELAILGVVVVVAAVVMVEAEVRLHGTARPANGPPALSVPATRPPGRGSPS
jgi:hypothetical protein